MPHHSISTEAAHDIVVRIGKKQRSHGQPGAVFPYLARDFERDVKELLEAMLPFSILSGLRLFSPTHRSPAPLKEGEPEIPSTDISEPITAVDHDCGFEMDNIFHFHCSGDNFIVVVESKNQPVQIAGDRWQFQYESGPKCAKEQVDNHIKVLWEYLEPLSRQTSLRFIAIVCCSEKTEPKKTFGYRNAEVHLTSFEKLPHLLESILNEKQGDIGYPFEVYRVRESGFLNLLRMSLPVGELGHPELSSAIRYVERCRRNIDDSLFQYFEPTPERWVINGSAGMGKSVLLAYTAAVLSTGYALARFQGEAYIHPEKRFESFNLRLGQPEQSIVIAAMSGKQLENLKGWFSFFIDRFRSLDKGGNTRVLQPDFVLCRDENVMRLACEQAGALLVDEAHDLEHFAVQLIAESHKRRGFYLVVACDRHQKLRLSRDDARIIPGLDFTNKSKRLKQIYRNPISVYIASLALMFRWGAKDGPKIIPKWTELKEGFGFKVDRLPGQGHIYSIMNDAHPANSWSHNVVLFPSAEELYNALASEQLAGSDVLWARFSEEDPDFNYEKLSRFTYHNCRTYEAHELSDKYVKGQEFPIVVIEGFPSFVDKFNENGEPSKEEDKMWSFRREIYLCASRATCFLYFLCRDHPATAEKLRFLEELKYVIDSVATPRPYKAGGTRRWSINVSDTPISRKPDVFEDSRIANVPVEEPPSAAENVSSHTPAPVVQTAPPQAPHIGNSQSSRDQQEQESVTPTVEKPTKITLVAPITVNSLAQSIEAKPFKVIEKLMSIDVFVGVDHQITPEQAKRAAASLGFDLEVESSPEPEVREDNIFVPSPSVGTTQSVPSTTQERASNNVVELTAQQLSKLPPQGPFNHSIDISGPVTVMELAKMLGVQHRDIINAGTRLKQYLRGGTMLGPKLIARIAGEKGFGIEVKTDT